MYPDWTTVESLRRSLPPEAKPSAHWRTDDAAFLSAHVAGRGICSVVRLHSGKTEILFDRGVRTSAKMTPVSSLDLDGAIVRDTVVLFGTEARLASSAISFDTGKVDATELSYIVTGIAPGMWEIWRDGWVVDLGIPVRSGEAVLHFKERPGSYFARRL